MTVRAYDCEIREVRPNARRDCSKRYQVVHLTKSFAQWAVCCDEIESTNLTCEMAVLPKDSFLLAFREGSAALVGVVLNESAAAFTCRGWQILQLGSELDRSDRRRTKPRRGPTDDIRPDMTRWDSSPCSVHDE